MIIFYYTFFIFIVLFIAFKFYIKVKFGFWAYQPVFHYYNLFYWIYPKGIINKELSETNKFCNFYNIQTTYFEERDENTLKEIIGFLRTHYYNNKCGKYLPTKEAVSSYFIGNNSKTFISTYYKTITLINEEGDTPSTPTTNGIAEISQSTELISVMTGRPLNMTLKNSTVKIYYIDYLCVHSDYRKEGIAPEIIQTHEYMQCHKNKKAQISLFKREGVLTGIVPLTVYKTYQFSISCILKQELPHASMKLIEINKLNIRLLTIFIHSQKEKFDCLITPDITNLINLVNNDTYKIYAIIENDKLIACYFFKDSHMHYDDNQTNKFNIKSIDYFASISNCHHNEIFIKGFSIALHKYSKKIKARLVTIENISDNNIIINNMFLLNIIPKIVSPTAYFLYNYAKRPILPEKTFLLI